MFVREKTKKNPFCILLTTTTTTVMMNRKQQKYEIEKEKRKKNENNVSKTVTKQFKFIRYGIFL